MALSPPIHSSLSRPIRLITLSPRYPSIHVSISYIQSPKFRQLRFHPPKSIQLDTILAPYKEEEKGEGFYEAIKELESMTRDPSDVLTDMIERLSSRELQLVLVYFTQEGRDSYCALEVFDWLKKENRVDGETMELMVSIACGWIERLIDTECGVVDVVALIGEMECVGVEPGFSMVEKVVSLYWEKGRKDMAVEFVKEVMRRGGVGGYKIGDENRAGEKAGPVGILAWKTMVDGDYRDAVKLVIEFKETGFKPEVFSYLIGLTALVKEQKEFSKNLRKLNSFIESGKAAELDTHTLFTIEQYQSSLISKAKMLSHWALLEGKDDNLPGLVHERLLSLYTCAGRGLEAERQLWQMKLLGKEPDRQFFDIVLAICASQNETGAVHRLLAGVDSNNPISRKKSLSLLLRGYMKGGFYLDASDILVQMLDSGLLPEYYYRAAVLQGLRKIMQETGDIEPYVRVCKKLSDMDLVGPCVVYLYMPKYKLWVINML
ncbi:pentatricopeptide (PPR) repeat-containing protein [Carex rostrata]